MNFTTQTHYTSKDFESFKFFNFNRPVSKPHVKLLAESIKRWGFNTILTVIKTDALDGQEGYYVLDGQHRFSAAQLLDIPFHFIIVEVESKLELAQFIADANNSAKAWGTNQFLNVWAKMEIPEYVKLLEVQEKTQIQITPLVKNYTGQSNMTEFRKGTMTFPDVNKSDQIVAQIIDLKGYLPEKAFCRRAIVDVMSYDEYDHEAIKPLIIRRANSTGFTENESELKKELISLIKSSKKRATLKVA